MLQEPRSLRLPAPNGAAFGACSNWTEGPRGTLESKLPSVFTELERRAEEDDRRDEERRQRQEEHQRQEEVRRERARLQRIEDTRVERLRSEVASWRLAGETRQYIAALRERLDELDVEERERIAGWCDWAEEWVSRSDPAENLVLVVGLETERDASELPLDLVARK